MNWISGMYVAVAFGVGIAVSGSGIGLGIETARAPGIAARVQLEKRRGNKTATRQR
jgi:hypothetical protein